MQRATPVFAPFAPRRALRGVRYPAGMVSVCAQAVAPLSPAALFRAVVKPAAIMAPAFPFFQRDCASRFCPRPAPTAVMLSSVGRVSSDGGGRCSGGRSSARGAGAASLLMASAASVAAGCASASARAVCTTAAKKERRGASGSGYSERGCERALLAAAGTFVPSAAPPPDFAP